MRQIFYILFGAGLTVGSSVACGKALLRRTVPGLSPPETVLLGFSAGSGIVSLLVFGICAARLAHKGVILALATAILGIYGFQAARIRNSARAQFRPALPKFNNPVLLGLNAILALFLVLYFFHALAPEISQDGSTYHLGLVARYLREHGFVPVTTNMYAGLPQGMEMLFLFAFSFGRNSAAALVHFAFLVALAGAMILYSRRFRSVWNNAENPRPGCTAPKRDRVSAGSSGGATVAERTSAGLFQQVVREEMPGLCAAVLFFASPVVGKDGISAYNDVALACVAFSLFYLLRIWHQTPSDLILVPAGLLAGFACAIKYTGMVALPYAILFVLWNCYTTRRALARPVAIVLGCALVLTVPWMAKNWILAQNPFAPFLNAIFPNPYIHAGFEREYVSAMRSYGLESRWQIPLHLTVFGARLGGALGPVFLLSPIALIALRDSEGRRLLAAGAFFVAGFAANSGARFLIPALPFVSLAMMRVLSKARFAAPTIAIAHAVISWPAILHLYAPLAWSVGEVPVRAALRMDQDESYLLARLPGYGAARIIETHVPANERVFALHPVLIAYTSREVLVGYEAAYNQVLEDILRTALIPEYWPTVHTGFRFAPVTVRSIRLLQSAEATAGYWSINELHLYSSGREIEGRPAWRVTAHPNRWEAALALDGTAMTRWSTWQPLEPGMFLEVDFGRNEAIDALIIESAPDSHVARLRLEARRPTGDWSPLPANPEARRVSPPPEMRRAAMREFRRRGINYLLINDHDYAARDLRENARLWGVRQIAEFDPARLYKID
jgi:hypothetical protein